MSTSKGVWYERQATISKIVTYAAILLLLASMTGAIFIASENQLHEALFAALGGIGGAALLAALSAIIDLMIVHAEAMRNK